MISVEVTDDQETITQIADEWDALVEGSFTTTFSRPGWYLAWLDAFTPKQLTIITARAGNRLVGVLPLSRIRTDERGLYFTIVAPIGAGRADYQAPIVDRAWAATALPAMLDAAFEKFGRRGVFWWPNIPVTAPELEILRSHLLARHMVYAEEGERASRARLVGTDYSEAEKVWSRSHRIDVRRQRKRLSEKGPVSLWMPATIAEADAALSAFFQVYDEKWLTQGYPGKFQDPAVRHYHRALMRRLWERGIHFSTVRCGAMDVSYHFGFFSGGWLQWYRPTYRPEYAAFSPGKIHVALLIEHGYKAAWQGVDFLLGEDPYKAMWSNETLDVVRIHAGFHKWSPSYLWFTQGKPFVRQKLQATHLRMRAWAQQRRRGSAGRETQIATPQQKDDRNEA
jgi:CelD/BcsL family acetyltransferase involved in cellulose biosynthesis